MVSCIWCPLSWYGHRLIFYNYKVIVITFWCLQLSCRSYWRMSTLRRKHLPAYSSNYLIFSSIHSNLIHQIIYSFGDIFVSVSLDENLCRIIIIHIIHNNAIFICKSYRDNVAPYLFASYFRDDVAANLGWIFWAVTMRFMGKVEGHWFEYLDDMCRPQFKY